MSLVNRYEKYWIKNPIDWHKKIIGIYHVTGIGNDHSDLEPESHSGPCLRQTFYNYINPIENSISSKGNFHTGHRHHKDLQKIAKENDPFHVIEFPLMVYLKKDDRIILVLGSIDLLKFKLEYETFKNEKGFLEAKFINPSNKKEFITKDVKTASSYTLPKNKFDRNPTHFDQEETYTYMISRFYFNRKFTTTKEGMIVYVDKHNLSTYELFKNFKIEKVHKKWLDFEERCFHLDDCLRNLILPDREPMHWCKYCKYRKRCRDDVTFDTDIKPKTEEELMVLFKKETGKNAIYNNKITKGYLKWKETNF